MKRTLVAATALLAGAVAAAGLNDFATSWPVAATREGAYTLALTPEIYARVATRDLSDLSAFNGAGEALPFGPMPASMAPPPSEWRSATWFALPAEQPADAGDLSLHIRRTTTGELSLDATLSHASLESVQALLVDVRAKDALIEAMALDLAMNAPDFNTQVSVESSEDLQQWQTLVPAATVAQLRQGGQALLRRHIDLPARPASYLRVRTLAGQPVPVRGVRLQLRADSLVRGQPPRQWLPATAVRRDGRAYFFRLPAPVPVDQINIELGDENRLANFSISARQENARNWTYVGQLTAFKLRGAGVALDNEAMAIGPGRLPEWRIESSVDLAKPPVLRFGYRPETWMLLTHGKPPYAVAAGSSWARRDDFPLEMLVGQVRARYGQAWKPDATSLGPAQAAGGEAALNAYNRDQFKSWALWGVLVLAALVIAWMVLRLLRSPPPPNPPAG